MTTLTNLFALLATIASLNAAPTLNRRDGSAIVNLANNTGTPSHYGSGILYGVPDTLGQIPDAFYNDMGFNYLRAGGAQIGEPGRGWLYGVQEYKNRFQSALSNYKTARSHNAPFVIMPSDLYGADTTQSSDAAYPGDNGDFTDYDNFLDNLFADIESNGMTDGLVFDIWNEPDLGTVFWGRSQAQYLDMWTHTYDRLRDKFGTTLLISGPSSSSEPNLGNGWFTAFAAHVKNTNTVPDQWTWHMETGGSSMDNANDGFQKVLAQYGLPQPSTEVNINEYAIFSEQNPTCAVWWLSQLERHNSIGLRGNWLSTGQLHDFLASLLSKPGAPDQYSSTGTGYYTNGEYQVYKYYATQMTGYRLGTSPSPDMALDVYATVDVDAKKVRILAGTRNASGSWAIELDNLSSLGLPEEGTLVIQAYGFPNNGHYGQVDAQTDYGTYGHAYSGNTLSFPIWQTSDQGLDTAYAFEFDLP